MCSEDEAYNNFITTSDNDDSAKENATSKQPKTSNQQYQLITSFIREIDETLMTKGSYDQRWNDLAVELNKIGPPVRDSWEWRRVWSVYKYNRKRKHSSTEFASKRRFHEGQPIADRLSRAQVPVDTMSHSSQFTVSLQILEKLNEILGIQLDSNELLEKIVASLSTK